MLSQSIRDEDAGGPLGSGSDVDMVGSGSEQDMPDHLAADNAVEGVPQTAAEWDSVKLQPLFRGAKVSVLQHVYFLLSE
jgi:hypothetical protein